MIDVNNSPLVSIIIPTYNYAKYLIKTIKSCIEQTYKNLEIIIIDDGSTDNTYEVVMNFSDRIVYVFQHNSGVSAARNKGLELARGEFIAFLDADDYLTEDSVETRLNILLAYPDIGIIFSETYSEDADGGNLLFSPTAHKDYVSEKFYEDLLIRHLRFQTSAAMMRSSLAKKFRFPTNLSNGEDIAYFTKIFFTTKAYFCVKPTVINRRHPDSLRHNIEEIKRQGNELIETIFDDPYYNGALEYLRKDFTARRYLEFFRRFYHAQDKTLARKYYVNAIFTKPGMILKVDYLIKFLKTCL